MKKKPTTYTSILQAIKKSRTVKRLTKVRGFMMKYDGSIIKTSKLIIAYNEKNRKLRYPNSHK